MKIAFPMLAAASIFASQGLAANVYVFSSGSAPIDNAVVTALTSRGHTATVGVQFSNFNGTVDLTPFQTVYLQANANWTGAAMPTAGGQQLVAWVNGGGRLVTSEWVMYYSYASGKFAALASIVPGNLSTYGYGGYANATYTVATTDPDINAGLPSSFTFPLVSYGGTETFLHAKAGATTYYQTNNTNIPGTAAGLLGWPIGAGSVFSFTSTCGPAQLQDANFGRLFANVMGAPPRCGTADFNRDGDIGTDADIEAFFNCLAGSCCARCQSVDFNGDGDLGTDADIEAFFRVLSGGPC